MYNPDYPGLYYFDTFTLTTLGTSGHRGPDPTKGYANAPWNPDHFSIVDGQQQWTVPATGTYNIVAAGAYGATPGRVVSGDVNLYEGQVLSLLVGQLPTPLTSNAQDNLTVGGGGGTFVASDGVPLIVASGGDGTGGHAASFSPFGSGNGINGAGYLSNGSVTNATFQFLKPTAYIDGGFGNIYIKTVVPEEGGFGGGQSPVATSNISGGGGYTGSPGDGVSGATCYADPAVANFTDMGASGNTAGYVTISLIDPVPIQTKWSWIPNTVDTSIRAPTGPVSWFNDVFFSGTGQSYDGTHWDCISFVENFVYSKPPVNPVIYWAYSSTLKIYVGTICLRNQILYVKYSYDKINWQTSYTESDGTYSGLTGKVIWVDEFSKFFVQSLSNILSSTDGISWSSCVSLQTSVPSISSSLVYAPGIIVSNNVYSTDGITWVPNNSSLFHSVVYSQPLSIFIASIEYQFSPNLLKYSYDGQSWSTSGIDLPSFHGLWSGLIWSNEHSVFSMFGVDNDTHNNYSAYSYDGIHWSVLPLPLLEGPQIYDAAYSPPLDLYIATSFPDYLLSIDGKIWLKTIGSYPLIDRCAWNPQLGIFVARSATTFALSNSKDGIEWNLVVNSSFCDVAYSGELNVFIALPYFTANLLYSYDGTNFVDTMFQKPDNPQAMVWSKELGLFCSGFAYSRDGKNWVSSFVYPIVPNSAVSIGWSPDLRLFTAIISTTMDCYYSNDGITWTFGSIAPMSSIFPQKIVWASYLKKFFAIDFYGDNIYYSTDGIHWTFSASVVSNSNFIVWVPEINMLAIQNNYSYDGIQWEYYSDFIFQPVIWVPEKQRILCSIGYSEVTKTF